MRSVGVLPALAIIGGAGAGRLLTVPHLEWWLLAILGIAILTWVRGLGVCLVVAVCLGLFTASLLLASHARERALDPVLRRLLDAEFPGFVFDEASTDWPEAEAVATRFTVNEDAAVRDDAVSMPACVRAVHMGHGWQEVPCERIRLSIGGDEAVRRVHSWRAGRTFEAPVQFRRPTRHLNDGVADAERDLLLGGVSLSGAIKSAWLVEPIARGPMLQEMAGDVRAHVRRRVGAWIGARDPVAGGIVTAVLIGDRTGLPDDVRERLQRAGTYHVIAISGGNIAILVGLIALVLFVCGIRGRMAAAVTIVMLGAYALLVTAGPSVWRATLMAILYLAARLADQRTSPWQAMAVAAAVLTLIDPLGIAQPGFLLTFGATAALVEVARRTADRMPPAPGAAKDAPPLAARLRRHVVTWIGLSVVASLAVEAVLAPIAAQSFFRLTVAGLVLNLASVPLMAVVQTAGLALVCLPGPDWLIAPAGWIAGAAARAIVESAGLVDIVPALSWRVPPPGPLMLAVYYVGLGVTATARGRLRAGAMVVTLLTATSIATGRPVSSGSTLARDGTSMRLTMLDVGQGESVLLETGGARPLLIDTGGVPFGEGSGDIGGRVIAPALWARGVRSLGALLITHADPDHVGGAAVVADAFHLDWLWQGIDVPSHEPGQALARAALAGGARLEPLRAGETRAWGRARIRVLHPPAPDWERMRVRNDDSVVLEVRFGDVAVLVTGDISGEVEQQIVPMLSPAPVRVLKVAHHGSRTSSSPALMDAWRSQIALISCGRGNPFGHPAREVLTRLQEAGSRIYRTDKDGQITLTTDGRTVNVETWMNKRSVRP